MWLFVIIIIVSVGGIGSYFLIANSGGEADDVSPLINDAMDTMDAATKADFEEQTEAMADTILETSDDMPGSAALLAEGEFMARAHGVEGKALLIQDGDNKVLRFEDFDTDNGPNLHIYLASSLGNDDFIDLGKIKATKGNVNYEIPDGVDVEKYDKVLVWCVPFGVLFSYAELD